MIKDEKDLLTPDEEVQLAKFKECIKEIVYKNLTTTFSEGAIEKTTLEIVSYLNEIGYQLWMEDA